MSIWYKPDRDIILASNSPRRKEILTGMGLSFSIASPDIENEEDYLKVEDLIKSIENLSIAKAVNVSEKNNESLVLGSDTLVFHDNKIIGKPVNRDEAFEVLQKLSGTVHQVYTGVALLNAETKFQESYTAITDVYFRNIDNDEIEDYLNLDEYGDKAGAYAIQGRAMNFVEKIDGCFYNVMGLPIKETINLFASYMNTRKGL